MSRGVVVVAGEHGLVDRDPEQLAESGLEKHMAIVEYLKAEHGMGHGHANALAGWTLARHTAAT